MKIGITLSSMLAVLVATGCGTSPKNQCKAAIAHSATEYDVCIGSRDVRPGDRVVFYKQQCTGPDNSRPAIWAGRRKCSKKSVGEAAVIKTLDDHLSTVRLDAEFEITDEMTIEKKR